MYASMGTGIASRDLNRRGLGRREPVARSPCLGQLRGAIRRDCADAIRGEPTSARMATQDLSGAPRMSVDRSQRGGSIGLVLLVAVVLVSAAVALLVIGRGRAEPYILGLLAVLAGIGVFALFAIAAGILRMPGKEEVDPLIKAVTDTAHDGLVVTDPAGRVVYANATYLNLVNAVDADDVRPVERVFVGDPDVSEAVYRLAKAAREGRRLQEEVRMPGLRGEPARWLRLRGQPLGTSGRGARATASARKTYSRSCSTRSTISTTRPPASSRSMRRERSYTSTRRSRAGSI